MPGDLHQVYPRLEAVEQQIASVPGKISSFVGSKFQSGTDTLAVGQKAVAATLTSNSRIFITMKDPGAGAITGFAALEVGSAGRLANQFTVTAIDDTKTKIDTAVCTFDWLVVD
jgi:hypothetical protein